jgi:DNA-binding IclR family transcriptional regulator
VILVDVAEAPQCLRLSLDVGDMCPLHATAVGKAIAAHMTPAALEAALGGGKLRRFTSHTISSRAALREELNRVRRRGYALNEEESIEGALLVGAPIFDSLGNAFAAVSVNALAARCSAEKRRAMIAAVKHAAEAITKELVDVGFRSAELQ